MNYSERIHKTAELLVPGTVLADIGCDHGYMGILSVASGKFRKVYACDVAEGPLSRARKNIREAGMEEQIRTILSDGFACVPSDTDAAVICGMGGLLIRRILEDGESTVNELRQIVLGPHSEQYELRSYILRQTGFGILRETTLKDGGRFYTLLDLRPLKDLPENVSSFYADAFSLEYGCDENQTDPEAYRNYLRNEYQKLSAALQKMELGRSAEAAEKKTEFRLKLNALEQRFKTPEAAV